MAKPKVTINPVANAHTAGNERIIEYSSASGGGLIEFRELHGRLSVFTYRHDDTVEINPDTKKVVRKLLADWFDAALYRISDTGCSLDWPGLIEDAKARHEALGVPWDNSFVPGYVRDIMALSDDD